MTSRRQKKKHISRISFRPIRQIDPDKAPTAEALGEWAPVLKFAAVLVNKTKSELVALARADHETSETVYDELKKAVDTFNCYHEVLRAALLRHALAVSVVAEKAGAK